MIGRPKRYKNITVKSRDYYIGDESSSKCGILQLTRPITKDKIDFEEMEKIWNHSFFNELRVAPEDHFVLMIDNPLFKNSDRYNI